MGVANLMLKLKRNVDNAQAESAIWARELAVDGDDTGVAGLVWRRIIDAIGQLANTIPLGPVH